MLKEEKKSAEQFVYEKVEEALYKRRLAPGAALTEQSLCDALGVGRTPVRGALRRLADKGFVEIITNRGAFVAQTNATQIDQLYEVRDLLELHALKKTINTYTEEDFKKLNEFVLLEEEAFHQKELKKYLYAVNSLHQYIVQKSGNPYLESSHQHVSNQITVFLALYDNFYIGVKKKLNSFSIHRKMITAIQEQNLKKFEKIQRELKESTISGFDFSGTLGANVSIALLN